MDPSHILALRMGGFHRAYLYRLWVQIHKLLNKTIGFKGFQCFNIMEYGSGYSGMLRLTLFLQVTCTRYLVSGHRDSCASGVSVNKLPMRPPPDTSHVTKHWLGTFIDVHVMSADVREPSRIIEWMFNLITSNWVVLMIDACNEDWSDVVAVQLFQHWKIGKI